MAGLKLEKTQGLAGGHVVGVVLQHAIEERPRILGAAIVGEEVGSNRIGLRRGERFNLEGRWIRFRRDLLFKESELRLLDVDIQVELEFLQISKGIGSGR